MQRKQRLSLSDQKRLGESQDEPRDFVNALKSAAINSRAGVIAEIKKASPSQGFIRENFDPVSIAKSYEQHGAACLSVLTDAPSFQGAPEYLVSARAACALPVLRKDFMYDTYQVAEARSWGGDAILIIMAAVSAAQAQELYAAATQFGMDTLFEVHDADELECALTLKPKLLGINNRDLRTFETTLDNTRALMAQTPDDILLVSESGIASNNDVRDLMADGIPAFLVGESLMRQDDVEAATKKLIES